MVVAVKVQPIDRDLVLRLTGTDATRSAMLADFAKEVLAEGEEQNRQVLGRVPPHDTYVDRQLGASEDSVKPDGVIVYEFELTSDALSWIGEQLQIHSPIGSGRDPHPGLYQQSHTLFADGTEVEIGTQVPQASEYVFINNLPYARKIEGDRGRPPQSSQAPDGVYEAIATMASARFGNSMSIRFTYTAPEGGSLLKYVPIRSSSDRKAASHERDLRQPAIIVTPR